jgi:hypothetical protein
MSSRIHSNHNPQTTQHTEADLEHAHGQQAHVHQGQVSQLVGQRIRLRNKLQHNKALAAAFYRNKRFALMHHKPASASGQKLMRQLGQRPRPGGAAKPHGKQAERTRHEEVPHERNPQQGDSQGGHEHGHEHGHDKQEQGRQNQGQGQRQGQGQGQGQQSGQNQQRRDEQREQNKRGATTSSFKIRKASRAARAAPALPATLQTMAQRQQASPAMPQALLASYTHTVVQLTSRSKMELGPLLAPLLVLSATGPMVRKRQLARLATQRNAALAQQAAIPGKGTGSAELLGHTLDLTQARRLAGIEYGEGGQSLAMVRQHLLDASGDGTAAAPAAPKFPTPDAS